MNKYEFLDKVSYKAQSLPSKSTCEHAALYNSIKMQQFLVEHPGKVNTITYKRLRRQYNLANKFSTYTKRAAHVVSLMVEAGKVAPDHEAVISILVSNGIRR